VVWKGTGRLGGIRERQELSGSGRCTTGKGCNKLNGKRCITEKEVHNRKVHNKKREK
jgi:hypothetical protein